MRWWDRRLRKVADRYTTMRVRIAVGTNSKGEWSAAGGSNITNEAARFLVTGPAGGDCVSWVEAEVLVPVEPTAVGAGVPEGWEPPPQPGSSPHPQPPQEPQGSGPAHHTAEAPPPSPSQDPGSRG